MATLDDAPRMSRVLLDIIELTGRDRPHDPATVIERYIRYPGLVRCSVAEDEPSDLVGFQSLILAGEDNIYGVTPGWGIIGTHVSPRAHRRGVGTALFKETVSAARAADIENLDAYIAADNLMGLKYYEAIGFRTYREHDGIVQKCVAIDGQAPHAVADH